MKQLKSSGFILLAMIAMQFLSSCTRIDSSAVGIKVHNYGTERGVGSVTEVTGWVWYNPISVSVYEFPINIRHKEYNQPEDTIKVFSRDGSEFHIAPILNYQVKPEMVPLIFVKYRKDLDDIEKGYLKTAIQESFRIVANEYTADSLISKRQQFDNRVKSQLQSLLDKEGFVLSIFTYSIEYPKSFRDAINAKNNAVQEALKIENQVRTVEAEAKKQIAKAHGDSVSTVMRAHAEAEANRLKQVTLTPMLLQQKWIETWDGHLPTYMLGSSGNTTLMMPMK